MKIYRYLLPFFLLIFLVFYGCIKDINNQSSSEINKSNIIRFIWTDSSGLIGIIRGGESLDDPTTNTYCFKNSTLELLKYSGRVAINRVSTTEKSFYLKNDEGEAFCRPAFFIDNSQQSVINLFKMEQDKGGPLFHKYLKTYIFDPKKGVSDYNFNSIPYQGYMTDNTVISLPIYNYMLYGSVFSPKAAGTAHISIGAQLVCDGEVTSSTIDLDIPEIKNKTHFEKLTIADKNSLFFVENWFPSNLTGVSVLELYKINTELNKCSYKLTGYNKLLTYTTDSLIMSSIKGYVIDNNYYLLVNTFSEKGTDAEERIELLRFNIDNKDVTQLNLSEFSGENLSFALSNSGHKFALMIGKRIVIADINSFKIIRETGIPDNIDLSVSAHYPDGSSLFFDNDEQLYLVGRDSDGMEIKVKKADLY